jgi:hypothetical protein
MPAGKTSSLVVGVLLFCAFTTARARALDVERADYVITVPEKSTVDPQKGKVDPDHMTTINLPNENSLIVIVADDKARTEAGYEGMKKTYAAKLTGVKETPSHLFDKHKGTGVKLAGTMKGTGICFELGWFTGNEKGFIIVTYYADDEVKTVVPIALAAINSFKIKEPAAK